jgi:hypothetical protein
MVGLLFALPNTQLQRRLAIEGRLRAHFEVASDGEGDQCMAGPDFETRRPRLDILRDHRRIIDESYAPAAYCRRVLHVGSALDCRKKQFRLPVRSKLRDLQGFARLVWRMGVRGSDRLVFWRTLAALVWRDQRGLRCSVALMALYLPCAS